MLHMAVLFTISILLSADTTQSAIYSNKLLTSFLKNCRMYYFCMLIQGLILYTHIKSHPTSDLQIEISQYWKTQIKVFKLLK